MLSEGWDAKTVTHIMGLRAFTSQLLCEQVVGVPHEVSEGTPPPPTKPRTRIEPLADKRAFEISWPNVVRIDQVYGTRLALDLAAVKPLHLAAHESFCVFDSTWEASEAFALDHHPRVAAWVKNDHLGFEVHYLFEGGVHKYRPDFLVRLGNGVLLVLETKGQETAQDRTKREFMTEWVAAVNEHAGFGRWSSDVSRSPSDLPDLLAHHGA